MDISIVIPSYNALGKLERCLTSLRNQSFASTRYEVIFVDDCSTDGTYEYLQQQAANEPNWQVLQLSQNSGSPSRPRNVGADRAKGDYVFYLDCDDEILPDTLEVHFSHAKHTAACIVRGYLLTDDGARQQPMNRLTGWSADLTLAERISKIISEQSTTVPSLIKRSVLQTAGVSWPESIRVGEDSVFLCDLLAHCERIEYLDHPTFIYNRRSSFQASSTQEYGSRELNNHLIVWQSLIDSLAIKGLDYVKLRLRVGLQSAIRSLIFCNKGDITTEDFDNFTLFVKRHQVGLASHSFASHIQEVLNTLYSGDFERFKRVCKPRLVIAGHDLKFILPLVPMLSDYYQVEIDEWSGHDAHDVARSEKLLHWADYIWCEWLLGNAVWYSERKKPHQKLVIRMHRFELGRDFGERINIENVDAVLAVSVLFFERLLERFPNIPRGKVRLLPNYIDGGGYKQVDFTESRFNLAMIGFVPAKKGFADALKILKELKQKDKRYKLKLFGKTPADIPWLKNEPEEVKYFEACERYIQTEGLEDSCEFIGFTNIKQGIADNKIGFVLSVSEAMRELPGFESFHIAVADAYAAGAIGLIRYWTGCEYVYPSEIIYENNDELVNAILSLGVDKSAAIDLLSDSKAYIEGEYSLSSFTRLVSNFIKEL